ncbi:MAG: hypothetical protein KDH96_07580 [Candidatus Riesia sp.]|nr:hypothetical protein [Candidatus Riesia sp.]
MISDTEIKKLAQELQKEAFIEKLLGSAFAKAVIKKAPRATEKILNLTEAQAAKAPKVKNFFGLGSEMAPVSKVTQSTPAATNLSDKLKNMAYDAVAEPLLKLKEVQQKGLVKTLGDDWNSHKYFTKTGPDGVNYRYKRSLVGRALNPMTSGLGFAGTSLVLSDPKEPMSKRLGNAAIEGATWTFAPKLTGAYYLTSMAKNLMSNRRQA